jgi:hypothetical protein
MWVAKTARSEIVAYCMACRSEEMIIHNWHETLWADGMMEPLPASSPAGEHLH